jgi:hypothetical protein
MPEDRTYTLTVYGRDGAGFYRRDILGWNATKRAFLALPPRTRFAVDFK